MSATTEPTSFPVVPVAWCKLPSNWNKTIQYLGLLETLGERARSLPCDLWAYCAASQTDGDLSKASAPILAKLLEYKGPDPEAMVNALISHGYLTKERRVVKWNEDLYHLARSYKERTEKAGKASAAKRKKSSPLSGSPQSDTTEDKQEDKQERREQSHVEHDVQHDAPRPPPSGFLDDIEALALTPEQRSEVGEEFSIGPEVIDKCIRHFNEKNAQYPDDPRTFMAFKGWLRTSNTGKEARGIRPRGQPATMR